MPRITEADARRRGVAVYYRCERRVRSWISVAFSLSTYHRDFAWATIQRGARELDGEFAAWGIAAVEGWGPITYEVAMTIAKLEGHWLTSSGSTSLSAGNVLDRFLDRGDVLKRPLSTRAVAQKLHFAPEERGTGAQLAEFERYKFRLDKPVNLPFIEDAAIVDRAESLYDASYQGAGGESLA